MKNASKRIIAMLLAFVMVIGILPFAMASQTESIVDVSEDASGETTSVFDENLSINMNIAANAAMEVTYSFLASKVASFENFYLTVDREYADAKPGHYTYSLTGEDQWMDELYNPISGTTIAYSAEFTGISANEMGDKFTATLYGVKADGTVHYGPSIEASIKDHLMAKIDEATDDVTKTMAVDMLHYGAAAQVYFGYGVDKLVTADLTEAQLAYATKEIPEAVDTFAEEGEGVSLSTNVIVQDRVILYLTALYTPSEIAAISVNDPATNEFICMLMTRSDGTFCTANFSNIGAREMRHPLTYTLYDGRNAVSKTITWSVESYVAQVRADENSSAEQIAMVNALLTYGDSVAAYLEAISK